MSVPGRPWGLIYCQLLTISENLFGLLQLPLVFCNAFSDVIEGSRYDLYPFVQIDIVYEAIHLLAHAGHSVVVDAHLQDVPFLVTPVRIGLVIVYLDPVVEFRKEVDRTLYRYVVYRKDAPYLAGVAVSDGRLFAADMAGNMRMFSL